LGPQILKTIGINIVNVSMPSAEERAELTAIDRKLDAIAAKLREAAVNRYVT
jgi:hypothetical protein